LLVEDDDISALICTQALSDIYQSKHVTSGQDALDFCQKVIPDLILMDINMPGLSGLETCNMLKSNPTTQDIPIIFITAHSDPLSEDECWDAGCVDFITKPFSVKTLRHRVNAHLTVKNLTDKLKRLATYDGLTDIPNRRFFDGYLHEQARLAARHSSQLGVLMIDIDYFKPYNDTYGHLKGDECLKLIADTLSKVVERPTDCVARYGGEEFVMVLPNTGIEGVRYIADRLLEAIRALNLPHSGSNFEKLTVSIGGTTIEPGASDIEEVIARADKYLYQAKNNGRNRAVVD
jgi:diguanylate cyclase (GGDEF)-like protein